MAATESAAKEEVSVIWTKRPLLAHVNKQQYLIIFIINH